MWFWYALLTSVLWGLTYTCTEITVKYVDMKSYLTVSCAISTLLFLFLGVFDGSLKNDLQQNNFYPAIIPITIGTIASFLACYSSVAAVKYSGAATASIIEISYPIWVIVFTSILNGGNTVNIQTMLGGAVIFIGTVVIIRSH